MSNILKKINVEFLIGFLLVGGMSFIMQLFFYFQGYGNSTNMVLSLNLLLLFLIFFYIVRYKPDTVRNEIFFLFVCFCILWHIRLYYDAFIDNVPLRLPIIKYYAFSIFSVILPFFYGNFMKSDKSTRSVLMGIIWGVFLFCITAFILFRQIHDHRIGEEERSVNPLTISYTAAMIIAYYIWKSIENFRTVYIIPIVVGITLLAIGASKGPVIVLLLSLLFVLLLKKKLNYKIIILLGSLFLIFQYFNMVSFDVLKERFENSLSSNFESNEKELRYYLWKYVIEKFVDNPFLGYSLEIRGNEISLYGNAYPHNIILEALLSTGFLGAVLILTMIVMTLKNAIIICKIDIDNTWLLLFFLINLFQYMVSGSINDALCFWFFVGMVNGRYAFFKKENMILKQNLSVNSNVKYAKWHSRQMINNS